MSFEAARTAVVEAIKREEPDNGVHLVFIDSKLAAAKAMTEDSLNNILNDNSRSPLDLDPVMSVATAIKGKMASGGRRRKTRRRSTKKSRASSARGV
jgi:hypothetical protein